MALKIYDTLAPQGEYPAVKAEAVEMPDGTRLSEFEGGAPVEIVNNLTSTATNKALSANQGRVLQGNIDSAMQSTGLLINACVKSVNGTKPDANGNVNVEVGASITVDSALSTTSTNPIQNKAVAQRFTELTEAFSKTIGNVTAQIPSDNHINELIDDYLSEALGGDY